MVALVTRVATAPAAAVAAAAASASSGAVAVAAVAAAAAAAQAEPAVARVVDRLLSTPSTQRSQSTTWQRLQIAVAREAKANLAA